VVSDPAGSFLLQVFSLPTYSKERLATGGLGLLRNSSGIARNGLRVAVSATFVIIGPQMITALFIVAGPLFFHRCL